MLANKDKKRAGIIFKNKIQIIEKIVYTWWKKSKTLLVDIQHNKYIKKIDVNEYNS